MKKTITIPQNRQSFTIPAPFPLVAGDVNAYEVVLPLPEAADGAQFTVQAKRANNQVVTDTVQISGAEARYTLKSNMYDIAGSLFLRLQVVQDGSILSECQLDCEVLEAYGSDVTADDRLPALSSAIVQTQEATAAASTAAQAANEAAEAANAAAQEAEGVAGRVTALENNTTLIQNSGGGFAAGTDAEADTGAAVGRKAWTGDGGAVGYLAYAANGGGSVGKNANSDEGGAAGANAKAGAGFAGGKNAKAVNSSNNGIDAIQLGTGTNSAPKTMQVYGYQLLDANGKIPDARLNDAPSDGTLYGRKNGGWAAVTAGLETVDIDDIDDIKTEGLYRLNNYFEEELPSGQTADQKYVELLVVSHYVYVSDPSVRQTRYKSDGTVITREFNYMDNGGTWYDWQEVGHTHANKAVLDATEVAYTESDQARIGTLENDLDGLYAQVGELESTAVTDAPSDGNTYARKDGAWTGLTSEDEWTVIKFIDPTVVNGEYGPEDATNLDDLPNGITIVRFQGGADEGGYIVMTERRVSGSGHWTGYQYKISSRNGLEHRWGLGEWGEWEK